MPSELRDLLQQAAPQPQEQLDGPALVDRARRRHRRQWAAGAAVALAAIVTVAVAVPSLLLRSPAPEVAEQPPSGPEESEEEAAEGPPEPVGPKVTVLEGIIEGDGQEWSLIAWRAEGGGLCLEKRPAGGTSCGRPAQEGQILGFVTSGYSRPQTYACTAGTVDTSVATVRLEFGPDEVHDLTPETSDDFNTAFYGTCWKGAPTDPTVVALNAQGDVLGRQGDR